MDEVRLDRFEEMLTNLITITGNLNQQFQTMQSEIMVIKQDIAEMKTDIAGMKSEITEMKTTIAQNETKNESRHLFVIEKLIAIQADQDLIWEKSVRNEREIAKMKRPTL